MCTFHSNKYTFLQSSMQVKLSDVPDGCIHIGDAVCLLHSPTKTIVSGYMSAARSHEATQLMSGCDIACSRNLKACPRNVFIIGRYNVILWLMCYCPINKSYFPLVYSYDDGAKVGDVVRYGQNITFTTLPNEGGEVRVCAHVC